MRKRITAAVIAGVTLLSGSTGSWATVASSAPSVLVSYSFDESLLDSGPDTFRVYQHAKGTVRLSNTYRFSGYQSVEIRDVAGDRDFPELQGYFPPLAEGVLYFHFALMTTSASEPFNLALAGPKWFNLEKDAIVFWLEVKDGFLRHVSGRSHRELFPLNPFTWYVVDVAYDIERGRYALTIYQEGLPNPLVVLQEQANANGYPKSVVDKFSFIGDRGEDTSNVVYYVDDVVITTDKHIVPAPFVAPGRRKLFVDYQNEYQLDRHLNPRCLRAVDMADVGLDARDLQELRRDGDLADLVGLLDADRVSEKRLTELAAGSDRRLYAVALWRAGCGAMEEGEMRMAVKRFEGALAVIPSGKIYALSRVLALAGLGSWREVDEQLAWLYADWSNDLRFAAALAMIGLARGNLHEATSILKAPATALIGDMPTASAQPLWDSDLDRSVLKRLEGADDTQWRRRLAQRLISEQYFYVLLWQGLFQQAEDYASAVVARLQALDWSTARWLERAGDAAFFAKRPQRALVWYANSLNVRENGGVLLKLSDVYFSLGDLQHERYYRERIYGSLISDNRPRR